VLVFILNILFISVMKVAVRLLDQMELLKIHFPLDCDLDKD